MRSESVQFFYNIRVCHLALSYKQTYRFAAFLTAIYCMVNIWAWQRHRRSLVRLRECDSKQMSPWLAAHRVLPASLELFYCVLNKSRQGCCRSSVWSSATNTIPGISYVTYHWIRTTGSSVRYIMNFLMS